MIEFILSKINMYKSYRQDDFVFVYQMGKVGSDSLCKSLGADKSDHIHTLYGYNPNSKFLSSGSHVDRAKGGLSFFLKRLIIRVSKLNRKTKIITLVREPSKRDPSMFFQDIDGYIRKERSASYKSYVKFNSGGVSELCKLYLNRYDFNYGLNWLDNELRRFTGIDLYKESFKSGVCLKSNKKYEVLCIRIDKLNSSEEIISDFVGRRISLKTANLSEEKWYEKIYSDFLLELVLPISIKSKYERSKLSRWLKDA